jgi:hypothetical protein
MAKNKGRERERAKFIIRQKGIKFIGMWRDKAKERERERGGRKRESLYRPKGRDI